MLDSSSERTVWQGGIFWEKEQRTGWVCKLTAAFGVKENFFWCLLSVTRWSLFSEKKLAWVISSCLARTDTECYDGNDKNVPLAKKVLQRAMKYYKLFLNTVIKH